MFCLLVCLVFFGILGFTFVFSVSFWLLMLNFSLVALATIVSPCTSLVPQCSALRITDGKISWVSGRVTVFSPNDISGLKNP